MELRHLRYFVAVAEDLSFTKEAAKLHPAQPSLTRQIHNLEQKIGVRLLNRNKNQVALTEEGGSFLVDARRMKKPFEEIRITDLAVDLTQAAQEAPAFRRLYLKLSGATD